MTKPDTKEKSIPFHRPFLGKEEEDEVIDTLRSGWLTTGPKTKKFESEFAQYVHAKHAIAVNSCTSALHLALVAAGVSEGDEVITTPITFASTANVIVHQRATPVFVDVESDTLNIDPNQIEDKITSRTKAIMPVHFAGQPCEMDTIMDIARRHKLIVIEDAAHAIEAEYQGRKIGSIGGMTAFSFYPTKNMTTGEGGMLTTDNSEWADKIRILSLHGMSKDAWKRYAEKGYQHWDILSPGYKYNMSDIQAALGLHQLQKVEGFWKIRKRYAEIYNEGFQDIPEIITLPERPNVKNAHHLYVIRVKTEMLTKDRDEIINIIQDYGVGIGIHFRAIHLHPYYQETFGFRRGILPNAEYASDRLFSLPLYPKMQIEDVFHVIDVVKQVIDDVRI